MTKHSPALTWTTIKYRLGDLIEYDKNPVQISERDAKELARSLDKYEHVLPYVAAAPKNGSKGLPLLDGHQRKMVELSLRKVSPNTLVDVRVPSRKLSDKEKQELVIRLRKNTGSFDFDKLANFFEVPDLLDWGFTEKELQLEGFEFGDDSEDEYSRKIEAPIYTPKGDKPNIVELFDTTRTQELIKEIDATELPDGEKEFLRIAAQRHTVLNFKRIAEYYAHSDEATQSLMENSALVIIDFDKAIELGYVKLSEEIAKQYQEDYPNA